MDVGELICECLLPFKTSQLWSVMDRTGGPTPTCIMSVYSSHLSNADQNCCVISLGPFSNSYINTKSGWCVVAAFPAYSSHAGSASSPSALMSSQAVLQGKAVNPRLSREAAEMMLLCSASCPTAKCQCCHSHEHLLTCTVTSQKVIWCGSMRTHIVNLAFTISINPSPISSGHFKHFSHPHEKKKKRSSQWLECCCWPMYNKPYSCWAVAPNCFWYHKYTCPSALFPPKATWRIHTPDLKMLY